MLARSLILLVCFVAAAGAVARADRPETNVAPARLAQLPLTIDDWQGRNDPPMAASILAVLGVDQYVMRTYVNSRLQRGAGLYVGFYQSQRQGDTMHSPLNCLPGAGWEPVSKSFMTISVPAADGTPRAIEVNRYMIRKGLDRQLVLYWYQNHGRVVASEYWGKFYLVKDAVQLNRTDGALVRVIVPVREEQDEAAAEKAGIDFVTRLFPTLASHLPS